MDYLSQQVNLCLDDRLTDESKDSLMQFVNNDRDCQQLFEKEKNFRDFIKNNIKKPSATPDLINSIKNKLP